MPYTPKRVTTKLKTVLLHLSQEPKRESCVIDSLKTDKKFVEDIPLY